MRNKVVKTGLKTEAKKVLGAVAQKDYETAQITLRKATSAIAKAASKGVLHKRAAARKVSRLAKKVTALNTATH